MLTNCRQVCCGECNPAGCIEFYDFGVQTRLGECAYVTFLLKSPVRPGSLESAKKGSNVESDTYLFGVCRTSKNLFLFLGETEELAHRRLPSLLVSHPTSISPPYSNYLLTVNPSRFLLLICTYNGGVAAPLGFLLYSPAPSAASASVLTRCYLRSEIERGEARGAVVLSAAI